MDDGIEISVKGERNVLNICSKNLRIFRHNTQTNIVSFDNKGQGKFNSRLGQFYFNTTWLLESSSHDRECEESKGVREELTVSLPSLVIVAMYIENGGNAKSRREGLGPCYAKTG